MSNDTVKMEVLDGVAHITLNRSNAGNVSDLEMAKALLAAVEHGDEDLAAHAAIISGSGSVFCAGADVRGFASQGEKK